MRTESKIKVNVGKKTIGGDSPLICLPLMASNEVELSQQAGELLALNPDIVEWRVDHYDNHHEIDAVIKALSLLRQNLGPVPLLFTLRKKAEGGNCTLSSQDRLRLNKRVAREKKVDLLDTELSNGAEFIASIKAECENSGVKLILSYHDFKKTPDHNFIVTQLKTAKELGAHIAKIAVMPQHPGDVLTLLNATYFARTQLLDIPLITISMGGMGAISRIAGGLFGSDVTFASGTKSSAPGQIVIDDMRLFWSKLAG